MGKYRNKSSLIDSSRLSFSSQKNPNNKNKTNASRLTSKYDARLKLLNKQNNNKNYLNKLDARELLLKKQQKEQIQNLLVEPNRHIRTNSVVNKSGKKEPLIIVTGLANVRKEGSKLKVVKSDHKVVSDGVNTIVTVRNNLADKNEKFREKEPELLQSNSNFKFRPIKIQIENDNLKSRLNRSFQEDQEEEEADSYSLSKSKVFYNSKLKSKTSASYFKSLNEDNEMDVDESNEVQNENLTFTIKNTQSVPAINQQTSIDLLSNGYKLVVSNLHPKVTEDDILELFSDIGPIKRARFLDKGLAEVIYVKLEHAKEAIQKYDKNELDGRAMKIELVQNSGKLTNSREEISKSKSSISIEQNKREPIRQSYVNLMGSQSTISKPEVKNSLSNKFKSVNSNKGETTEFSLPESKKHEKNSKILVDSSIIHQALFNKKAAANTNPVTFTVKL